MDFDAHSNQHANRFEEIAKMLPICEIFKVALRLMYTIK